MKKTDLALDAIRIEGSLLPAEFIQRLLELKADHQSAAEYGVPPGIQLRDDIGRSWRIATTLWASFQARRHRPDVKPEAVGIKHWLEPFLTQVLGFGHWTAVSGATLDDRHFPLTHTFGATPLLLIPDTFDLDRSDSRFGDEGRRRSPQATVQEYLNAGRDARWGLVSNGRTLRILRDNPSLTRPAYIEADLARIFEEDRYADFVALWLIAHATRFGNGRDGHQEVVPILEHWHGQAQETGERALEKLRAGVTEALRQLGNGFLAHPANAALRLALANHELQTADYFRQLLRLVYRLILLVTAEDRGLLHHPDATPEQRTLYARGYSAARLRERALKARADRHADLWDGLRVTFRGLAGGAEPLGLPALGGLFAADRCPDLDAAALPNQHLLAALRALCFFRAGAVLARINYRDMDTEELGSVYESLLEQEPLIAVDANPWRFGFVGDAAEGNSRGTARKLTGSYYTPDALVQECIQSALEPKIAEALKAPDPRGALLALRILDPATGSGHFLLAAARRIAAEVARLDADDDLPEAVAYRHALREVAAHCIYGVDLNPLAVELCQTALWLETLEPGQPLGFLDHRIRHGNALVGILDPAILAEGIPDKAYAVLSGDDKAVCSALKKINKRQAGGRQSDLFGGTTTENLAVAHARLADLPEDSLAAIAAKRAAYAEAERDERLARERLRFDLFCAAFFAPKTPASAECIPLSGDLAAVAAGRNLRPGVAELAADLARQYRFFHWPLIFPEVFAAGGFDVVLANPPWEVSQLSEEEFFAVRSDDIARLAGAARKQAIANLEATDLSLWKQYFHAKRGYETFNNYAREAGRYSLTAIGKLNLYGLFSESITHIIGGHGRAGIVTPSGLVTDDSNKRYFQSLIDNQMLVQLLGFDNAKRIFPSVHSDTPFSVITIGKSDRPPEMAHYLLEVQHIADTRRRFILTAEDFRLINPNTRTCPVFRAQVDAELTKRIYRRVPVLINEGQGVAGNPWSITFRQGLFNMTSDSHLFRTAVQLAADGTARDGANWIGRAGETWVPLYEAKMVHQFDHRWATYEDNGRDSRDMTDAERCNPASFAQPRYWVQEIDREQALEGRTTRQWLMGWRDITNATNERTVIAGAVPRVGVGNNMPIWFVDGALSASLSAALLANFCSLILDFVARHKVGGTHLNFFIFKQLPILPPDRYTPTDLAFIVPRVLELTYTAHDLAPFARDLDYDGPPFAWDPDRRAQLRAELDAWYARLYGLTRDELRYILDPADVYGEDYPSETFRVLKNNEIRQFGEYRTRRLVLEAWDQQASSAIT